MNTIRTNSGIQINPFASISDILSGTSFNDDREAQGHLQSLADAFHDISKTDEGQVLLCSMEGKHGVKMSRSMLSLYLRSGHQDQDRGQLQRRREGVLQTRQEDHIQPLGRHKTVPR